MEKARRRAHEENDKRFEKMEEKMRLLTRERDEALVVVENWKAEALRPGLKRGGILIGATPSTQARVRPRCVSPRSIRRTHAAEMAACHAREVATLKELRAETLDSKKEKESEIEKLKEKLAALEMERQQKVLGTNLRAKMDEAAKAPGSRSAKGKERMEQAEYSNKANDKEVFILENRRVLKPLKKDAISTICLKEGIAYSTLDRTKEDIVNKRVLLAFGGDPLGKAVEIEEVSEDTLEESIDLAKIDGQETSS
ncbi:hypothetical protein CBR_g50919 [Chara braunii]|uniref:Uncharacterized protein n=1 Tax=Chara braunii TaxID=69332 RepID=A0A388M7R5_CHABU|nr:hypothetical protein CBR_g50919 [Chara braunii]|eukprot:GBG90576.1 hypothetical protein CBR_g50919 [Chara braunii]